MNDRDAELTGLMRQVGARRAYDPRGFGFWRVPPWECPYCVRLTGDRECAVQPGCPDPLARHGPLPLVHDRSTTSLSAPRPTLFDCDYTCPHCHAGLRLEQGDSWVTMGDDCVSFRCGLCGGAITVRWDDTTQRYWVVP